MKKIIISPYARALPIKKRNAKNYPWFKEIVEELNKIGYYVIQIGTKEEKEIEGVKEFIKNKTIEEIAKILKDSYLWISVDNMVQHLANTINKRGIVIYGKSNPKNFGYSQNINVIKDEKYFRKDQFSWWMNEDFDDNVFVKPDKIIEIVKDFIEVAPHEGA